ncbi:hypothetical protein LG329_14885 [Virgibacillus necropolis]|uniref:hypothetical protein n=1 Tax=Virgibacillus necropolis TaxID=163877 RepID=UPI00384AAECC
MESSRITNEFSTILKEPETEAFLLRFQNYVTKTTNENQSPNNKNYSLSFYRDLPLLDRELGKLNMLEKKLLIVKVDSLITYIDDITKISFPSPFIIGVFTAVISLILGVVIRDPAAFPKWTIVLVTVCFFIFIPGISWFTLEQSGKNAELKEILTTIKGIVS